MSSSRDSTLNRGSAAGTLVTSPDMVPSRVSEGRQKRRGCASASAPPLVFLGKQASSTKPSTAAMRRYERRGRLSAVSATGWYQAVPDLSRSGAAGGGGRRVTDVTRRPPRVAWLGRSAGGGPDSADHQA